jgi:two-component system sensor histidine kinase/response regulator
MKSVFAKLAILQLAGGLLGVAILYVIIDTRFSQKMTETYATHGQVVAQSLAKAVEPALVGHDLTSVQSNLDAILASPGVEWACVTAPDGEVLAHTLVPRFPESISIAKLSSDKDGQAIIMPGTGKTVTVFTQPVLTGIVGEVHIAFGRENLTSSIHKMEWLVLGGIAGVMLAVTLGFALLAYRIMAPIRALTDAAVLLGGDQQEAFQAVPVRSKDEIGVLTNAFNSMASEIGDHREFLETRVRERTDELVQTNEDLAVEVSERKRMEGALLAANNTLREFINASPVAIAAYDLEGIVQSWNPAAERLFGWTEQQAMGRFLPFVSPDKQHEFHQRIRRALQGEDLSNESVRRARRDGSPVELSISSAALRDVQGNTIGVISVIMDITERKRVEEEMQKARAAAEAANRTKSEFLANMSHEIRTPMNGVIGMTELALDTDLTLQQREYLGMVKSSADALMTVINDILDFSKIDAGKLDLDPIEFKIRDSIEDAAGVLALRAHQKGLELVTDVDPGVPEMLVGDPVRLRQILLNLLGNAVKFTDVGEVVLRVEAEKLSEGVSLHFMVRDTGVGIPADRQKLVFEPFTQADNSTTRKYGGTGLGLTITSRLVALMGGRIWIESEPGEGSVFHFTATFASGRAASIGASPQEPIDLRNLPVLVVDDNQTNGRILKKILLTWGLKPTVAISAKEALAILKHAQSSGTPFPLLLSDLQMPGTDGFALVERIRHNPELAGATIIMLTSVGEQGDAARCRELGVKAYLTKPIKQSDLRQAILSALSITPDEKIQPALITRHSLREARPGFRILLAEDNAVNQMLARRLLEKKGHTVVTANNGLEALAILETESFDAALMDMQMPEMDGFEATQAIREKERRSGKHLPIVALTAHAMKGDEERCLAVGMDGYISKPIRTQELFAILERLVLPMLCPDAPLPVSDSESAFKMV